MKDIFQSNLAGQVLEHKLHFIGGNTAFVVLAEHPKSVLEMCLGVHLPRLFLDDEAEVLEKKHKI